jgi:hypothetical protein
MIRFSKLLSLVTLLVLLTSCEHKELCFHHFASLRITFDWVKAPNANPSSMRVYLYPVDDEANYTVVDLPREGGYIKDVAPGEYKLLCFNNNETSYERNVGSFVRQSLTTSLTSYLEPLNIVTYASMPVAAGTDDEDPHLEPETIWGCTEMTVTVTENGATYHTVANPDSYTEVSSTNKESEIILYPEELTSLYTVEIRNVKNLSSVQLISATLSGLSEEINLSTGNPSGLDVVVPFGISAANETTLIGSFSNFGSQSDAVNRLVIYALLGDNKLYAFGVDWDRFNVTEQVRNAQNPHRVHIIIDGLELPQGIGDGSGFGAEVDGWGEEILQDVVI